LPGIVFFARRVKKPNNNDWTKLVRVLNYLKAAKKDSKYKCRQHSNNNVVCQLAAQKDMRSGSGAVITLKRVLSYPILPNKKLISITLSSISQSIEELTARQKKQKNSSSNKLIKINSQ
jgi:hypothetical protein